MLVHTKSGREITLSLEGYSLLTTRTDKGILVEIRDKEGNLVGILDSPQMVLP